MRAIETHYNGFKFRSRLEARWAVFFDTLGVKYEYEPQGYELPSGRFYLPDFRVKCYGVRGNLREPGSMKRAEIFGLCHECRYGNGDPCAFRKGCSCSYATMVGTRGGGICTECNGFELYDGDPFDLFIEVKGRMTHEDASRIREFANLPKDAYDFEYGKNSNPVLIVGDIPREGCSHDAYSVGAYGRMDGVNIRPFNYETIDGDHFAAFPAAHKGCFYLWGDDGNYIRFNDVFAVEQAYSKARQARFEHRR